MNANLNILSEFLQHFETLSSALFAMTLEVKQRAQKKNTYP